MKRVAVLAGSFDPVTTGHTDIIRRAAGLFDELYVIIGVNPDKKYMFSEEERLSMLRAAVEGLSVEGCRIFCDTWDGPIFKYCERVGALVIVKGVRSAVDFSYERELSLQAKALCPSVETVLIPAAPELEHISSSFARELIKHGFELSGAVPPAAARLIDSFGKH